MRLSLVVPAAGSGSRLGCERPKALVELHGRSLLLHTLEALFSASSFDETVVTVPAGFESEFSRELAAASVGPVKVVRGGASRQESVALGLAALDKPSDLLCVHDAARPFLNAATLRAVVAAAAVKGAAAAASPLSDSLRRRSAGGGDSVSVDREGLWLVETPQVFALGVLRLAHELASSSGVEASDDASLVEAAGHGVALVESSCFNLKITRPQDLELAALLIGARMQSRMQSSCRVDTEPGKE